MFRRTLVDQSNGCGQIITDFGPRAADARSALRKVEPGQRVGRRETTASCHRREKRNSRAPHRARSLPQAREAQRRRRPPPGPLPQLEYSKRPRANQRPRSKIFDARLGVESSPGP